MSDIKIQLSVSTPRVGSEYKWTISYDKESWDGMNERERHEAMLEEILESGHYDWDYEACEDE